MHDLTARRRLLMDLGPLRRHRDFRLLWLGQSVTYLGSIITYVAVPYQVFALTRSSLMVGLLGLVEFVAILATAFVGGALADAVDRRRMVFLTEAALLVGSLLLAGNSLAAAPECGGAVRGRRVGGRLRRSAATIPGRPA